MTQSSKEEDRRWQELQLLEKAGKISKLERWPVFKLYSQKGILIGKYTADSRYRLPKGTIIIEEYKGTEKGKSYSRDYLWKLKHAIADYPECHFVENIGGKLRRPKVRFPSKKIA